MERTVVLMFLLGMLFPGIIEAQFNISSNDKLSLANKPESEKTEPADTIVENFFYLPQNGERYEWEKLLASNCYKNGLPREFVNRWFNFLVNRKISYSILKISSPKTNQKIISYSSSVDSNKRRTMVLIKEKGKWKIYQAGL